VALTAILVLTTLLAAGLAVMVGWFALQRMGAEVAAENVSEHLLDETPSVLKDQSLSSISLWAKLLERSDLVRIMRRHLEQVDLGWSVGRVTMLMLLAGSGFVTALRRSTRPAPDRRRR